MFTKLFLVTAAVVAVLVAVKDGRLVAEIGLKGECAAVSGHGREAGVWYACGSGALVGRPDLSRHNCSSRGLAGERELWVCPTRLVDGVTGLR